MKKIIASILVTAIAASLVACNNNTAETTEPSNEPEEIAETTEEKPMEDTEKIQNNTEESEIPAETLNQTCETEEKPMEDIEQTPESTEKPEQPTEPVNTQQESKQPITVEKREYDMSVVDGCHKVLFRFVDTAGNPLNMNIIENDVHFSDAMAPTLQTALDAGLVEEYIDNGSELYLVASNGGLSFSVTPQDTASVAGYVDNKKDIPIDLTVEDADLNTSMEYVLTFDYTPDWVQPSVETITH